MNDIKLIEQYVRDCVKRYNLNEADFFGYYSEAFDEDNTIPVEIDGKLNMSFVKDAAEMLGISVQDILNLNEAAAQKWYERFEYFHYLEAYHASGVLRHYTEDAIAAAELFNRIFDDEPPLIPKKKYDVAGVKKKIYEYVDACKVSTHKGADISNLEINTTDYRHFPKIKEMTESFLSMQRRLQELFFRALKEDLPLEEIREYNFLVYFFHVYDMYIPSYLLNYNNVKGMSSQYNKEGYDDFYLYAKDYSTRIFSPWQCAEFLQDKDLVQRYVDQNPYGKQLIREFSVDASSYQCYFVWSDAEPIMSEEEWEETIYWDIAEGLPERPYSECRLTPTELIIPKDDEDFGDSKEISELSLKLSGPVKKGGIISDINRIKRINEIRSPNNMERFIARFEARQNSNIAKIDYINDPEKDGE